MFVEIIEERRGRVTHAVLVLSPADYIVLFLGGLNPGSLRPGCGVLIASGLRRAGRRGQD